MRKSVNYPLITPFISTPKITAIKSVFGSSLNDMECYGINIWSQKASSAIYPILQQLEITLRNSIDKEAKKTFGGSLWWDRIYTDNTKQNYGDFISKINKAKKDHSTTNHDDIISKTDFYTWQAIFSDAHHSKRKSVNNALWPRLTYRVLKGLDRKTDEQVARQDFVNKLNEIRLYRNRLSHNDCIWVKYNSNNKKSAIDSILQKINDAELLIKTINSNVHQALTIWGVFEHAKRVCSENELDFYLGLGFIEIKKTGRFKSLMDIYDDTKDGKKSNVLSLNGSHLAIHKF